MVVGPERDTRLAVGDLTIAMLRGEEPGTAPPASGPSPSGRRRNVKRTVMTLVDRAGSAGVTAAEIVDRAREMGHDFDRGSVSSLLSKTKSMGALVFDGERYYPAGKCPTSESPSLRVVATEP